MLVKPYYTAISILVLLSVVITACKEKTAEKEITTSDMTNDQISISEDNLELVDLENIPFTMPNDWIYVQNPIPSLPNIRAQAWNPSEPQTILAVLDYKANTINELMKMLVEDQKKIYLEHSYTIEKDTVYTTTNYSEQVFLGKGVYAKVGDTLRFVHITTFEALYSDRLTLIDQILGGITFY